jgi:flagellar biosynthetic protein FliR
VKLEFDVTINIVKYFAVFSRIAAFTMSAPLYSSKQIPMKYKIAFVMLLTIVLVPNLPDYWKNEAFEKAWTLHDLFFLILSEVALGFVISMFVMIMLEILLFAGATIDQQMGFSMARIIDPTLDTQASIYASIFIQLFIVMFLIFNGHLDVIKLIVLSFDNLNPSTFHINAELTESIVWYSSRIFAVGLQIAMPIFVAILFVNIAMGLISRIGQDFPVLMLSFPLRIGIGLSMMISLMPIIIVVCRGMVDRFIDIMVQILG